LLTAAVLGACSSDAGVGPDGSGGASVGSGGRSQSSGGSASGGAPGTGGFILGSGGSATGGSGSGGQLAGGGAVGDTGGRGTGGAAVIGPPTGPCNDVPVNPNATVQAKNLLRYLCSQFGNHVLSGQQETSWSNPANDINYYMTNVGKAPAILGGDYLYPNGTSTRAIAYWNAGGIPMIRYHMGAPPSADSYQNAMGSANLNNVVTAGTAENTSFNAKLDFAAGEIKKLQDANVPVLWAPFHEVQAGGWFWWSKGTGAQYTALWKYMFKYLTTTKGLNNILWLLPFSGAPNAAYYPGKEFVDIAGPDTYSQNQPFVSTYNTARTVVGTSIPMVLHETGVIPQPATMFPTAAPWLLFNVWAGFETSSNTVTTIKNAYASPFTVTRDEIPSLK
jgi:hypothetical protein